MERARRWLAHERSGPASADEWAAAAERVYDKLHAQLAPLIGVAGVQALLVRSLKVAHLEFACCDVATVESSTKLRECLRVQEPAAALETAAVLFGTFFTLITTFIGERLTTQVLRSAWPALDEPAPRETKK